MCWRLIFQSYTECSAHMIYINNVNLWRLFRKIHLECNDLTRTKSRVTWSKCCHIATWTEVCVWGRDVVLKCMWHLSTFDRFNQWLTLSMLCFKWSMVHLYNAFNPRRSTEITFTHSHRDSYTEGGATQLDMGTLCEPSMFEDSIVFLMDLIINGTINMITN